jgi:cbb3-type cytochrome oxidase maturation protein
VKNTFDANKKIEMSAIYILIGISIPVAAGFLIAFLYAAKNGQFDDDYTPSIRMLMDDPKPETKSDNTTTNQKV